MISPFLLKVVLSTSMFAVTAGAGVLAIMLRRKIIEQVGANKRRTEWVLTLLSCFAGGVFMGTCFLDIFPHIDEHYHHFRQETGWTIDFPLPEFVICLGFFLVYLMEELILKVFTSSVKRKHSRQLAQFYAKNQHLQHNGSAEKDAAAAAIKKCSNANCDMSELAEVLQQQKTQAPSVTFTVDTIDNHASTQTTLKRCCTSCLDTLTHEAVINNYLSERSMKVDLLKSVTFAFAISFHSVLEGFALGVQDNPSGILTLALSLIIHKSIEAFSVGLQLSKHRSNSMLMVGSLIFAYSLMTPIGAIIGDFVTTMNIPDVPKEAIIIVLEALAAGTFIYVTFLEVLAQERANDYSNLVQLGAIVCGFLVITGIQFYEQANDLHSHDFHPHGN